MPILAFLAPVLQYILQGAVIKFIVMIALFALMTFLVPLAMGWVAPFVSGSAMSSAFGAIPSGVWFFLDFFDLGYGVPLLLSAYVAGFLIRRLPIIG